MPCARVVRGLGDCGGTAVDTGAWPLTQAAGRAWSIRGAVAQRGVPSVKACSTSTRTGVPKNAELFAGACQGLKERQERQKREKRRSGFGWVGGGPGIPSCIR